MCLPERPSPGARAGSDRGMGGLRAQFPPGFQFGVATSAYQIEGHAQGGAGSTHWDSFAATDSNVTNCATGAVTCDHYRRWAEDLDLAAAANFDVWRFSASWARVLPQGRGAANPDGLDFYDRLVDGMLARGLKPALTLYHWELPAALADRGGWQNRDIAGWFADYSRILVDRIGDRLWSVAPINEPWCAGWLGYFRGQHAPGLRDIRAAARAMHHLLLAHGRAIAVLRAQGIGNLGAVCNLEAVRPAGGGSAREAAMAREAALTHDAILNRFFLSAMFRGAYPETALTGLAPHLPQGWEKDFATFAAPLDWLGVNYYTRATLAGDAAPQAPWPHGREIPGPRPKTDMGWEVFPEGLFESLQMVDRDYSRGLPLIVTENGSAWPEATGGGPINDGARIAYLKAHLEQVLRALRAGIPVRGYYIWSLLDNFEWAHGYDKRFGLVAVDFESLKRTPKASYDWVSHALARSALP